MIRELGETAAAFSQSNVSTPYDLIYFYLLSIAVVSSKVGFIFS